jgi:hypothetical protein
LFFLHNLVLHHDSFTRLIIPSDPALSRVVHDFSNVATKKLLSAKGKGDALAQIIKPEKQFSDDRTVRNLDRLAAGDAPRQVVVR